MGLKSILFGQPEHERRCDNFFRSIREEVMPRYPQLDFELESTADGVEGYSEEVNWINNFPISEEYKKGVFKTIRRMTELSDKLSATTNLGIVNVWAWNEKQKGDINKAAEEIEKIGMKHRPEELNVKVSDNDIPYNAYIIATFK